MGALTEAKPQTGALYVEAAIIMPILLLVTFASSFFLLVAARHFSLQMLANEIAKDVSLSLQPVALGNHTACIPRCMAENFAWATPLRDDGYDNSADLSDYIPSQIDNPTGCWNSCAADRYLLAAPGRGLPYALSVTVTAYPRMQIFDETPPPIGGVAAAGDLFEVSVAYPLRAVWGGGIAFFGLIPATSKIYANAVGVIDKRENP